MADEAGFSIPEAALFAEAGRTLVKRTIDTGLIETFVGREPVFGMRQRLLSLEAIVFLAALAHVGLGGLPLRAKRELWSGIRSQCMTRLTTVEFMPCLSIDLERLAAERVRRAMHYQRTRTEYLIADSRVLGGMPVIKGTGTPLQVFMGVPAPEERLRRLAESCPEVPAEAFEAAAIYVRTHPVRGRPRAEDDRREECS